jgi:DNA-binding beta-propeller fold protein YncE
MASVLLMAVILAAPSVETNGQGRSGGTSSVATLPYKLVEFPAPATSAAGFPASWSLIQVSAVAISARGTVLVLHRGAHPILEFEPNGTFIRSWGDGMFSEGRVAAIPQSNWAPDRSRYSVVYGAPGCTSCGAHSIRVDPQGNIWVVDAAGHVIYKLNQDGKEIMRLGRKGVAGTGNDTFNLPTDVAFAPNGDVYVSDGYGSARVVKFSRDGKYLLQWGKRGNGPGEFMLPHNVVVDAQGRVYVTDRDNQRIEVFDANGKYLTEWKETGGVSGMVITSDGHIVTGTVLRDLNGNVIGRFADAQAAHGAAVDKAGSVYLAQLSGIVQKYVKQ